MLISKKKFPIRNTNTTQKWIDKTNNENNNNNSEGDPLFTFTYNIYFHLKVKKLCFCLTNRNG